MPTSSTPPQLQLSLGLPPPHHAFKRSFHQFGLDVDETDDTDAGSSSSSRSASMSASASSSSQLSRDSGSSYSSQGSTNDSYGHNERNKRARSERPDNARLGGASTALNDDAVLGGPGLGITADDSPSHEDEPRPVRAQPEVVSTGYNFLSGAGASPSYTDNPLPPWPTPMLPMPSFGPPTPTIADFAAAARERSHSRALSNASAAEQSPPGFSGMLSPRSSSPVPPPAVEIDVAMADSVVLDRDMRLGAATDSLRETVARARAFDRSIAPLRFDSLESLSEHSRSHSREASRPQLPPFDFEAFRRRSSTASPLPAAFQDEHDLSIRTRRSSPRYEDRTSFATSLSDRPSVSVALPVPSLLNHDRFAEYGPSHPVHSPAIRAHSSSASARRLPEELEPMRFRRGFSLDDDDDEARTDDANRSGSNRTSSTYLADVPHVGPPLLEIPGLLRDVEEFHGLPYTSRDYEVLVPNLPPDVPRSGDLMSSIWADRPISHPVAHIQHRGFRDQQREAGPNSVDHVQPPMSRLRRRSPPPSLRPGHPTNAETNNGRRLHLLRSGLDSTPADMNTSGSRNSRTNSSLFGFDSEEHDTSIERMVQLDLEMDTDNSRRNRALSDRRSRTLSRPWEARSSGTALPNLRAAILNGDGLDDGEPPARDLQEILDRVRRIRGESRRAEEDRSSSASLYQVYQETEWVEARRDPEVRFDRESRLRPLRLPRLQEEPIEQAWPLLVTSDPSPDLRHGERDRPEPSRRDTVDDILSRMYSRTGASSRTSQSNQPSYGVSPLSQLIALPPLGLPPSLSPIHAPVHQEHQPSSPIRTTGDFHRPGSDGRSFFESSGLREQSQMLPHSLLGQLVNNNDDEAGQSREGDFSSTSNLPRLQELRERYRLPVRRRSYMDHADNSATERRELDPYSSTSRWRHSFQPAPAPPQLSLDVDTNTSDLLPRHLRLDLHSSSESSGNSASARSSSEAAAYFASGSGLGSSEQPDNLRRRRSPMLNELFDASLDDDSANRSFGDSRARRSLHEPISRIDDGLGRVPILRFLSERREPVAALSSDSAHARSYSGSDTRNAYDRRIAMSFLSGRLPPSGDVDEATPPSLRPGTQRPNSMLESVDGHRLWNRGTVQPSEPPSLPPLQFERLSSLVSDQQSASESLSVHNSPWRRYSSASNMPMHLPSRHTSTRELSEETNALATHHATLLNASRSNPSTTTAARADRESSGTSASRASAHLAAWHAGRQDFQHAMNVLESDGLPAHRRQQFTSAFERERERDRSRVLSRSNTSANPPPSSSTPGRERWGELLNTNEGSGASRSGPWGDAMRRRRGSMSALFAPPPDNADNSPPNRGRVSAVNGHLHHHGMFDAFDAGEGLSLGLGGSNASRANAAEGAGSGPGRTAGAVARRYFRERANSVRSFAFRLGRNRPSLRNLGDFIRDEDFDTSYESLLALSATLGEVKAKATPAHVIAALPTALYKDWQTPDGDKRCPICLDDYKGLDLVLKAEPCSHWLHKECLEQWLHSASTCPVCRSNIEASSSSAGSSEAHTLSPVAGSSRTGGANSAGSRAGSGASGSGGTSSASARSRARTRSLSRAIRPLFLFSDEEDGGL